MEKQKLSLIEKILTIFLKNIKINNGLASLTIHLIDLKAKSIHELKLFETLYHDIFDILIIYCFSYIFRFDFDNNFKFDLS